METEQAKANYQLTLRVRKPLVSNERTVYEADEKWLQSVESLFVPLEDGSLPWQVIERPGGDVIKFDKLEDYISHEAGLRTQPDRMLRLLEADTMEGASEVAEKLRAALKCHMVGDRK